MGSNMLRTSPPEPRVEPVDRLKWEHVTLLDEMDRLAVHVQERGGNRGGISDRTITILESLEHHQEAEERFLFPLVIELGERIFAELRGEHKMFSVASDTLLSLTGAGDVESLVKFLAGFRADLSAHFTREETSVFSNTSDMLSPAQMDILRIKFASRKALEI